MAETRDEALSAPIGPDGVRNEADVIRASHVKRHGLDDRQSTEGRPLSKSRRHDEPLRDVDIISGRVIGRCSQRHRAKEFISFMNLVDRRMSARRNCEAVHVILDNSSTHKNDAEPFVYFCVKVISNLTGTSLLPLSL